MNAEQIEAFPKTTLEVLTDLAGLHRDDWERAEKALNDLSDDEKIAKRYEKAEARVAACRALVAAIDQAVMRERERLTEQAAPGALNEVAHAAADIVNSGALDQPGFTVTAEVTTTVDRHQDPSVVALYPGDDEPHVTPVGDRTTYAELVADYFTVAGIDHSVDVDEWQVLAENELTWPGGGGRNLAAPIQERDYGHRLIVAAANQGSAAGTQAA